MTDVFSALLLSDGPGSTAVDHELFGQFVGSWDLEVTWFKDRKPESRARGEWHFAWVLGGRAIQDIWIVPPLAEQRDGAPVYEYGTSLRFPDAGGAFWHSTWHGPARGLIATFIAYRKGEDIVLDRQDSDRVRWIFSDITPDRFRWRNEMATTNGASWDVVQDFTAVRRR